jgi:hypothetical protein
MVYSVHVLRARGGAPGRSSCDASAQIPPSTHGIIDGSTALEVNVSLMRRRLVRKFGSLMGLLAILLAALAPAVSQALASGAQSDTILSAFCSAASHTLQANTDKSVPSQHSAAGHWDACGYCNLAAHSPAAPPWSGAYQARVASGPLPENTAAQPFPPYLPIFAAQPRAPPVFV